MTSWSTLDSKKSILLYSITSIYLLASVYAMVEGWLIFFLAPLAMAVALVSLTRLDKMLLFIGLITPLSINLAKTGLGIGVSLPSEPIIFGVMILYLLRILNDNGIDKKIFYHPISLSIIFYLTWMFITTLTSSMFIVSLKQTMARFCFIVVFFYLGSQVFRKFNSIKSFLWVYISTFTIVIGYTLFNHASAGFTEKAAHTSMVPFYNDHTAYAAIAAMYVPILIGFIADRKSVNWQRLLSVTLLILFITSLVLSYTRASWVSLIAALLCYLVFVLRIKTWIVISMIFLVVASYLTFQTQITMELERNDEQSSTDYASHVQSASNITTDASNVERLNRWSSAWRMFLERPVFGWGPGTYMFQYAPFQKTDEKTIISTNFGEGGNAHSEYIGPLAEQGLIGSIAFILVGILTILRASHFIRTCKDPQKVIMAKSLLLGLMTYWVHGMLNNFLDTEKASLPFWGFIGALVALDVYHNSNQVKVDDTEKTQ